MAERHKTAQNIPLLQPDLMNNWCSARALKGRSELTGSHKVANDLGINLHRSVINQTAAYMKAKDRAPASYTSSAYGTAESSSIRPSDSASNGPYERHSRKKQSESAKLDGSSDVISMPQKDKHIVYQVLSDAEIEDLKRAYKEFELSFCQTSYQPHGYAAASRALERVLLLQMASRSGQSVLDVGGNYYTAFKNDETKVYTITPVLDGRDASRYVERTIGMNAHLSADEKTAITITELVSYKRAEKVSSQQFDSAIFVHSVYDIKFDEMATIMTRHKLATAYGTIMWSSEMMTHDSGIIDVLNVIWRIDHQTDTITFNFKGDSSCSYTHEWSNYLRYATETEMIDADGNVYFYEWMNYRNGIQFFKITTCLGMRTPNAMRDIFSGHNDQVYLKVSRYNTDPTQVISATRGIDNLKHEYLAIDRAFYEPILNMANRTVAKTGVVTYSDVLNYAISCNSKIIISGGPASIPKKKMTGTNISAMALAISCMVTKTHKQTNYTEKALNMANGEAYSFQHKTIAGAFLSVIRHQFARLMGRTGGTESRLRKWCRDHSGINFDSEVTEANTLITLREVIAKRRDTAGLKRLQALENVFRQTREATAANLVIPSTIKWNTPLLNAANTAREVQKSKRWGVFNGMYCKITDWREMVEGALPLSLTILRRCMGLFSRFMDISLFTIPLIKIDRYAHEELTKKVGADIEMVEVDTTDPPALKIATLEKNVRSLKQAINNPQVAAVQTAMAATLNTTKTMLNERAVNQVLTSIDFEPVRQTPTLVSHMVFKAKLLDGQYAWNPFSGRNNLCAEEALECALIHHNPGVFKKEEARKQVTDILRITSKFFGDNKQNGYSMRAIVKACVMMRFNMVLLSSNGCLETNKAYVYDIRTGNNQHLGAMAFRVHNSHFFYAVEGRGVGYQLPMIISVDKEFMMFSDDDTNIFKSNELISSVNRVFITPRSFLPIIGAGMLIWLSYKYRNTIIDIGSNCLNIIGIQEKLDPKVYIAVRFPDNNI